jgi:uncharacterized protein (TIGR02145 family)
METKKLLLMPALLLFACTGLQAQVIIGSVVDEPAKGALLDLNSSTGNKGGLLLSNVSITNRSKIPIGTNLFPGITDRNDDTNTGLAGAMVYNVGTEKVPAGVYIWNGGRWVPPSGEEDPSILYDAEMNDYTTGNFDAAGTWMTQNLRTREKMYVDIDRTLIENNNNSTTNPYYTYPRLNAASGVNIDTAFNAHEEYGLLYNWIAASGRTGAVVDANGIGNTPSPNTEWHQGICPDGWHLPSDYEWNVLEKEIAIHPEKYATTERYSAAGTPYNPSDNSFFTESNYFRPTNSGYSSDAPIKAEQWGYKMKSTTHVNGIDPQGASKSFDAGGFDGLLVGFSIHSISANYSTSAFFWSSSSDNNDSSIAFRRSLEYEYTGVMRYAYNKFAFFSVRCKKNDN